MTDQGSGQPRPAGWKKDPSGRHFGRFWDGTQWTEHVISAEKVQSVDPLPPRPEPSIFEDAAPPPPPPPVPRHVSPPGPPVRGPVPTAPGWTPSAGGGGSRGDGVISAVRSWPRWGKWTAAIVLLVIVIAAASSGGDDDKKVAATGQPTTTRETASQVTAFVSTPPPTPAATTATTTPIRVSREGQLAAFAQAFEKTRVGLADAIKKENPGSVSSVDRLEYDPSGPVVIMNVTSGYSTAQYQRDSAWAITKSMQPLWDSKTLASLQDVIPRFRLTVSAVRYECPHDFMVRLAALRASREDWEATCRAA